MRLGTAWLVALVGALAVGVSGCIVEVTFDPIGRDASIAGSWTIEGAAPTRASCDAAGISNVRVRFFEAGDFRDHPDLVFPCVDGSFDTRPLAVVADGVWTVSLIPIDASGREVVTDPATPRETFDTIVVGGHISMTPVDFGIPVPVTGYAGSWTINGEAPDATNCATIGISEVWVQFLDNDGNPIAGGADQFACAVGSFSEQLDAGDYSVMVVGVDAANNVVAMAMREDFTLLEGTTHTLNMGAPVDFLFDAFDPRGMDASLDAAWTIGKTASSDVACEVAGGVEVEFVLYDPADTARAEGIVVAMSPCGSGIFGSTGNIIAAGTYLVSVVLVDAGNAEVGRADFDAVTLTAGQELDLTTTDIRLADTTLSFAVQWEENVASGTYRDCTDVGVDTIAWELFEAGTSNTVYGDITATMEACENRLTFSAAAPQVEPINPGSFDLDVEGFIAGAKTWNSTMMCSATVVDAGDLVLASCQVPREI